MMLTDLPAELLKIISSLLGQKDRKILRQVCRRTKENVILELPRLFISPNRTNIDVFKSVVSSPEFRGKVEEIVWDDARLTKYEAGMEFRNYYNGRYQKYHSSPFQCFVADLKRERYIKLGMVRQSVSKRWESEWQFLEMEGKYWEASYCIYLKLYEEQEGIIRNGEDVETFRFGLEYLPNLRRVTITSEAWRANHLLQKYETPFHRLLRSLPPGFRIPLPWPWLGWTRDYDRREPPDEELVVLTMPWKDGPHSEWRGYGFVIRELQLTPHLHSVQELVIDVNREFTGICYQLFETINEAYRWTLRAVESVSLTRLDLAINVRDAEEMSFPCLKNGLLKAVLSKLTSLESFYLHVNMTTFSTSHDLFHDKLLTTKVFSRIIFPPPGRT